MRGNHLIHFQPNCQNFEPSFPNSPSHKPIQLNSLKASCNTMGNSILQQSQTQNKFYSFKKIKEQRIRQKNQQGKVIKQLIYKKDNRKHQKLITLDDVKTIQSHNSPRSSISVGKRIVQQSIIIMRGCDLNQLIKQEKQQFSFHKQQPQTPYFKRRNTFNQQTKIKTDYLKPISINPSLVKSIESGMIFHYEIIKYAPQELSKIMEIKYEGVLQIYTVLPLKRYPQACNLVLYEPYSECLSQNLLNSENVSFKQILGYMIQIIKIASYLRNIAIYPEIQPSTVVLSNSVVKIKLRYQSRPNTTQRNVIRQCGYYFSSLVKSINGCCSTPSSTRLKQGIIGLSISKRIDFQNLMTEFIRVQDFSLDQAYLKIQALNY